MSSSNTETAIETNEYHFPYKNDLKYQKRFVNRLLNQAIEQAKISMLLPRFFENTGIVLSRLEETAFQKCAHILKVYVEDEEPLKKKIQSTDPSSWEEQHLISIIDLFQENYQMLRFFTDWVHDLTRHQRSWIDEFTLMNNTAREHFKIGAMAQLKDEADLHIIYNERKDIMQGLEMVKKFLTQKRRSFVATQQNEFLELHTDAGLQKEEILKEEASTCARLLDKRNFLAREQRANNDLQEAETNLQNSKKSCQNKETAIRAERDKWLIQLKALLKKYDDVMSEKFREKLHFDAVFAKKQAEHEEFLENVFRPAEKFYINIIKAKELEEERKRLAKVRAFTENHAARVIQLWYRARLRIYKPHLVPKEVTRKVKKLKKAKKAGAKKGSLE